MAHTLFVGSYAGQISTLSFTPSNSSLSLLSSVSDAGQAPSWVLKHRSKLYTADEFSSPSAQHSVYDIEQKGGSLSLIGQIGLKGDTGPVSLVMSDDGDRLFSANYEAGSISSIPLTKKGGYDEASTLGESIAFTGAGPNLDRQSSPHAHQVALDPTGRYLFVCDLGSDAVRVFDTKDGQNLKTLDQIAIPPGSGPRHLILVPFGGHQVHGAAKDEHEPTLVYLVNELANTLIVAELEYPKDQKEHVTFNTLQTISTLPNDQNTTNWSAAEVVISPDHKYLFVSNRSPEDRPARDNKDVLTIFELDSRGRVVTGEDNVEFFEVGLHPRHMSLSEDREGRYLAVACQYTNEVIVYRRQGKALKEVNRVEVEKPTCVIWG